MSFRSLLRHRVDIFRGSVANVDGRAVMTYQKSGSAACTIQEDAGGLKVGHGTYAGESDATAFFLPHVDIKPGQGDSIPDRITVTAGPTLVGRSFTVQYVARADGRGHHLEVRLSRQGTA